MPSAGGSGFASQLVMLALMPLAVSTRSILLDTVSSSALDSRANAPIPRTNAAIPRIQPAVAMPSRPSPSWARRRPMRPKTNASTPRIHASQKKNTVIAKNAPMIPSTSAATAALFVCAAGGDPGGGATGHEAWAPGGVGGGVGTLAACAGGYQFPSLARHHPSPGDPGPPPGAGPAGGVTTDEPWAPGAGGGGVATPAACAGGYQFPSLASHHPSPGDPEPLPTPDPATANPFQARATRAGRDCSKGL